VSTLLSSRMGMVYFSFPYMPLWPYDLKQGSRWLLERTDKMQGGPTALRLRMFHFPACYLKTERLKYTKL
jgi:hypothetical protein